MAGSCFAYKYHLPAFKAAADKGNIYAALKWAEREPETFLKYLEEALSKGTAKKAGGSAELLCRLLSTPDSKRIESYFSAVFPKDKPETALLKEAWLSCLKTVKGRREKCLKAFRDCLNQSPSFRTDAVVSVLKKHSIDASLKKAIENYLERKTP